MTLIVSDLDGTLLNLNHNLTEKSTKVIRKIVNSGIGFLIATGRHYKDSIGFKKKLNLDIPMITSNGAYLCDMYGKKLIVHYIPDSILPNIVNLGKQFGSDISMNIYTDNSWLVDTTPPIWLLEFQKLSCFYPDVLPGLSTKLPTNIQKIFFASTNTETLNCLYSEMTTCFSEYINCTFSLPTICEITKKNADKGKTLDYFLSLNNICKKDLIVFADGLNDLSMLQLTQKKIITANADSRLIEKLDNYEKIGHCDEDAVATYLENWLKHRGSVHSGN